MQIESCTLFLFLTPTWLRFTDGLAAALSFLVSILAAIWALELYQLLRTGAIGKAWKVFIVAAIVLMVHEVCHIARLFDMLEDVGLYEVTKLAFVLLVAYGFYLQRHVFFSPHLFRAVAEHRKPQFPRGKRDVVEDTEREDARAASDAA